MCLISFSCTSETEITNTNQEIIATSTLSRQELNKIAEIIGEEIENSVVPDSSALDPATKRVANCISSVSNSSSCSPGTVTLTEAKAQQLITPLVNDGVAIRNSIKVQNENQRVLTDEDILFLDELDDLDLATMSFVVALSSEGSLDDFKQDIDNKVITKQDWDEYIYPCLSAAFGIPSLKTYGDWILVKDGISAVKFIPFMKTLAKHYGGYFGIALTIYGTYNCLKDKKFFDK